MPLTSLLEVKTLGMVRRQYAGVGARNGQKRWRGFLGSSAVRKADMGMEKSQISVSAATEVGQNSDTSIGFMKLRSEKRKRRP